MSELSGNRHGATAAHLRRGLVAGFVAAMGLSGCVMPEGGGGIAAPAAQREAVLAAGSMKFKAARGYCVDREATKATTDGGFVLFGSCEALYPSRSYARPKLPIALAATVKGAGPSSPLRESFPALQQFFSSKSGRAALSRVGKASTVQVLAFQHQGDILLIHLRDTSSTSSDAPIAESYWRGLASIGGRMVSMSALPRAGYDISDADQRALLLDFAGRVEDLR